MRDIIGLINIGLGIAALVVLVKLFKETRKKSVVKDRLVFLSNRNGKGIDFNFTADTIPTFKATQELIEEITKVAGYRNQLHEKANAEDNRVCLINALITDESRPTRPGLREERVGTISIQRIKEYIKSNNIERVAIISKTSELEMAKILKEALGKTKNLVTVFTTPPKLDDTKVYRNDVLVIFVGKWFTCDTLLRWYLKAQNRISIERIKVWDGD